MQKIELHLGDPNLTLLHRAGLAGLWMTLNYFEDNPSEKRPQGLSWQLTPRQVTLQWEGNDFEVLDSLLKESFQLHRGVISLKCLDSKELTDIQTRLIVHQGILGTFLQHTSTHKSTDVVKETLQIDEDSPEIFISYKFLESYVYQEFAKQLCDSKGRLLNKPLKVAGWLNPGAVVRHIAFSADTSFEETPAQALMLLFAPVACCYFLLQSKLQDKKAQFALVIPEVTDLEKYAKYRQQPSLKNAGYKSFYASSLGDAGLQFLIQKNTAKAAKIYGVERCQVLTLGTVAWSTQQKTRTSLYTVEANEKLCEDYRIACNYFTDKIFQRKDETGYFESSLSKELITENLARAKPWYSGLSTQINNTDLFKKLTYEKEGLYQMVQKAKSDNENLEKLFVESFHSVLMSIYGQINDQIKNKGGKPDFQKDLRNALIQRESTKIRSELVRCRNAESFREFIVRFFTKVKPVSPLKENWEKMMQMVMGRGDWKLTRDLAMLALASYKGKTKTNTDTDLIAEQEEDDLIDIEV
jgi:CRISPR-associated protein Cas8a1/Csx13